MHQLRKIVFAGWDLLGESCPTCGFKKARMKDADGKLLKYPTCLNSECRDAMQNQYVAEYVLPTELRK